MDDETKEETPDSSSSNFVNETDGSYKIPSLRGPQHIADIGRECIALHHVFGVDMTRRGNLFLIQDERIVYAIANSVVFENTVTGAKEFLMGIDDGGVGCVTVHPSRSLIIRKPQFEYKHIKNQEIFCCRRKRK